MPRLTTSRPRSGSWIVRERVEHLLFVGVGIAWHVTGNVPRPTRAAFAAHQAACRRVHRLRRPGDHRRGERPPSPASGARTSCWSARRRARSSASRDGRSRAARARSWTAGCCAPGFESAEEFRRVTYIAALMRCFPGRNPRGSRRPAPAARRGSPTARTGSTRSSTCCGHGSLILVGQLAIVRFLGPGSFEDSRRHEASASVL